MVGILMLKEVVKQFLLSRGIYVSRAVGEQDVQGLIRSLRPMQTDKPLVRVGGMGDGGYLLPDDFEGIGACFSPGVGSLSTFEAEVAARGIPCFLADYSVDGPAHMAPSIHFEKKFIGSTDDDIYMRLESWIQRVAPNTSYDLLLQMDIEGGEYEVLLDTPDAVLGRFRILAIEFHELGEIFNRLGFVLINAVFQKLLKQFVLVHIHPNNLLPIRSRAGVSISPMMEFTFLRKDRVKSFRPATSFPHALDCANVPENSELVLPTSWYR